MDYCPRCCRYVNTKSQETILEKNKIYTTNFCEECGMSINSFSKDLENIILYNGKKGDLGWGELKER